MSVNSKKNPPATPYDDVHGEGPAWDEGTPGARIESLPVKVEAEDSGTFNQQLDRQADRICAQLPSHITRERFLASAQSAVKQNPELLQCTPRSLFNAITKAAQDGLLPDGREGVITSYKTKTKVKLENGRTEERYLPTAQWSPMTYGIRKRARELDRILIDAQVVYQNDTDGMGIIWEQGDDPKIVHRPAGLGKNRGAMIGVYAIFKREDGTILHREVMDKTEVEATREQSKAKDSLMWTTFVTEGWRKAVVRRGSKTVPVSDSLRELIGREDETFDFGQHEAIPAPKPRREPPPAPSAQAAKVITHNPGQTIVEEKLKQPEPVEIIRDKAPPEARTIHQDADQGAAEVYAEFRRDAYAELAQCDNEPAVEELRERILGDLKAGDIQSWKDSCAERAEQVFGR